MQQQRINRFKDDGGECLMVSAPIDTQFFVPRPPVAVVALGDSGEARLMRALLEHLGASVTLHLPGTTEDVLLILGDYVPGIDTSALQGKSLPPSSVAARVQLPGCVVVSTACATGSPDFSAAFLRGDVDAYIAPIDYPNGAGVALFVHLLFHQLLVARTDLESAWKYAAGYDETCRMFVLATKEGTRR